jgi:hypothetical protein
MLCFGGSCFRSWNFHIHREPPYNGKPLNTVYEQNPSNPSGGGEAHIQPSIHIQTLFRYSGKSDKIIIFTLIIVFHSFVYERGHDSIDG